MPKKVSFDINLSPKDPFFETPLGKILKWALSVGRYIVIFTELIVIISFVSRFTLDRQITDLNGSIEQKKNVIESFGDLEDNVRQAQEQITNYKEIEQTTAILEVFPALSQITPGGINLQQLIIKADEVSLSGSTQSQTILNTFINNITLAPLFQEVEVNRIQTDTQLDRGFLFTISSEVDLSQIQPNSTP